MHAGYAARRPLWWTLQHLPVGQTLLTLLVVTAGMLALLRQLGAEWLDRLIQEPYRACPQGR